MTDGTSQIRPDWYLVDTRTAAQLAHVRPNTIRVWGFRGRLQRAGTRRHALWDLREVLRCAGHGESFDS